MLMQIWPCNFLIVVLIWPRAVCIFATVLLSQVVRGGCRGRASCSFTHKLFLREWDVKYNQAQALKSTLISASFALLEKRSAAFFSHSLEFQMFKNIFAWYFYYFWYFFNMIWLYFCDQDLMFEYSYSVGNSPRRLLYEGRDFQHYFNLPSGDPDDDYKGKFDRQELKF